MSSLLLGSAGSTAGATGTGGGVPAPSPALEAAAWGLEVPMPHERRAVLRHEAAVVVDGLLARVARSRGALDVALCEGLTEGDRLMRLGFSCVGDYGREVLGLKERTAQAFARLGRGLLERPLLRAAVRAGEVSQRAAQLVLPVAVGAEEPAWVDQARRLTVRALGAEVRRRLAEVSAANDDRSSPPPEVDVDADPEVQEAGEAWVRATIPATPAARASLDTALEVAGWVLGEAAPTWQRVEALAQEYLGTHPGLEEDARAVELQVSAWAGRPVEATASSAVSAWRAEYEAHLDTEARRWEWLEAVTAVPAPAVDEAAAPRVVDARLREVASLRQRWEGLLGHLAFLLQHLGLWHEAGFASFGHYVRERLGLGLRNVQARTALERKLYALPGLRKALAEETVKTEMAQWLSRVCTVRTEARWLTWAEGKTCLEVKREVLAREDDWEVPPPDEAASLLGPQGVGPGVRAALGHQGRVPAPAATPGAAQMCAPRSGPLPIPRGAKWGVREERLKPVPLRLPLSVAHLLAAAFQAARREAGRQLHPSDCLQVLCLHFLATHAGARPPPATPSKRCLRRDRHRCLMPGCSHRATDSHHVEYRSQGGSDAQENRASLCRGHHLRGIHRGYLRVHGKAPDALTWALTEPP